MKIRFTNPTLALAPLALMALVAALTQPARTQTALPVAGTWLTNGASIYYNAGSVGVGTNSPTQKLSVIGDALVQGTDGYNAANETARLYLGDTNASIRAVWGSGLRLSAFNAQDALVLQQGTGNVGIGTTTPGSRLTVVASSGVGIRAISAGTAGGVQGVSTATDGTGVYGECNSGSNAYGVWGKSTSGYGVVGQSTVADGKGVYGICDNGSQAIGVYGKSATGVGVLGGSDAVNSTGVYGECNSGSNAYGVWGISSTGYGVVGTSTANNHAGVSGECDNGGGAVGVYGRSVTGYGVVGSSVATNGTGAYGECNSGSNAYGVWGKSTSGYAGYFDGKVQVNGNLSKSGGSFKIDHPLDPDNKYLYHSFVESPDMMNVYNGNVTTDARGYATITLPDWFETLNRDFRYQLTVLDADDSDQFVQAKVVRGVSSNRFAVRTSAPYATVSWQITGIRQDAWANAHRIPVEEDKSDAERGKYLHPELYGLPEDRGVSWKAPNCTKSSGARRSAK